MPEMGISTQIKIPSAALLDFAASSGQSDPKRLKPFKPRSTGQHTPVRGRTGLADALFSATQQRVLALVYGSVASHSDTAHSDIDLLLVSDALTLEQVYTVLTPVEQQLGRRVSPTLYGVAHRKIEAVERVG